MEKTPTTFTCFSGCSTRDVFRFIDETEVKPICSIGFTSISSMCLKGADVDESMLIGNNYKKRNIVIDFQKNLLAKINEVNSEYFIFDIICERKPVIHFSYDSENGKEEGYVLRTPQLLENWDNLKCNPKFKNLNIEREYFTNEIFDNLNYVKAIDLFCENLLKKYSPDKIIFNEVYPVDDYISQKRVYGNFTDPTSYKIDFDYNQATCVKSFMETVVNMLKERLVGINIVKFPRATYADSKHLWGIHTLHFNDTYYKYVVDCIKVVINENDEKLRKEKLEILYECQSRNNEMFIEIIKQNANDLKKGQIEKTLREKWQAYAFSFKHMIDENLIGGGYLSRELLKIGVRNIAIYGNTEITKVLVKEFNGTDVQILYIVENESVEGIKTIPRSSTKFEDVDLMLVADVSNFKQIEEKLKKFGLKFKIASAYEFLMGLKN